MSIEAAQFAARAHVGQTRKYNGDPYILHPGRVAARVATLPYATSAMVAAAWLHDVVEDCRVHLVTIRNEFGNEVANMVHALTNPSKDRRDLNREERKAIDREHIRSCSREVKAIKMIDRIDNLRDMKRAPEDFAAIYKNESILLLEVIGDADRNLADELRAAINDLVWDPSDAIDIIASRRLGINIAVNGSDRGWRVFGDVNGEMHAVEYFGDSHATLEGKLIGAVMEFDQIAAELEAGHKSG